MRVRWRSFALAWLDRLERPPGLSRLAGLAWLAAAPLAPLPALATTLPTFGEVRAAYRPSDVQVLDRRGAPLQTLRVDAHGRRLAWLALDDVSPTLRQALVLSEDRRFWEHSGVDWAALAGSAWAAALNGRTRGASTVTMQLAGLLDDELARPQGGRGVGRKLGQITAATSLETRWRKSEILEAYLNLVPLRGELVGINAATQTLFAKHASGLNAQEAALLAVLVRAPNAEPALVSRRACGLLGTMKQAAGVGGTLLLPDKPCQGLDALAAAALQRRGGMPLGEQLAPHAARQIVALAADAGGTATATGAAITRKPASLNGNAASPSRNAASLHGNAASLTSTLDARVQRAALQALREQLGALRGRQVEDGAALVLDNATGEVLAWVGSSGSFSSAAAVDAVLARRQPGSTMKPFLYAAAFERQLITPASLLHDAPTQLAAGNGLYLPQNYDRQYQGWVSARTALASSLNMPAVQVGAMLGPEVMFERLNRFGLRLQESAGYHGYALALGSAEVTLADLTNAYRALANGGRWSPWRLTPSARADGAGRNGMASRAGTGTGQADALAADPRAVFLVTSILADNNARALTFGLDSPLVSRGFAAVKTGTSKDMRDNWCIGFTDRYTVGVWVGNAGGQAMQQVSGTSGAAPVWHALVQRLHQDLPSREPAPPAGVQALQLPALALGPDQPAQAARREWFIAGSEPTAAQALRTNLQVSAGAATGFAAFGIRSPLDGSVFALDPDIPGPQQRIVLQGEPGQWYIDGRLIGRTTARRNTLSWAPWPGRHQLELRGDDGQRRQIAFEVRGASVRR